MSSRCSFIGFPRNAERVAGARHRPGNPSSNQRCRCSLEPCVQLSGLTTPPDSCWMWSSPTAPRRVDRIGDLLLGGRLEERHAVLVDLLGHVADPRAGEAVGLQLGAHAVAVGPGAVVRMLLHDAGDVLHVMPVLVGEHVELREWPGARVELLVAAGRRTSGRRRRSLRAGSRTVRSGSMPCRTACDV